MKRKLEEVELKVGSDVNRLFEFSATSEVRRALAYKYESIYPSFKNLHILDGLAQHRLYIPLVINKYINLMPRAKEESDLMKIINHILNAASIIGHSSSAIESINGILGRYKLWQYLPLPSIINYMFILSNHPDNLVNLQKSIKERFKDRLRAQNLREEMYLNPKSNLLCYRSFNYNTVLEPRFIKSNDTEKYNQELYFSTDSRMPHHEIILNCKIHAILNSLRLPHTEMSLQGSELYLFERRENEEIKEFKEEFFKILSQLTRINMSKLVDTEKDQITKWEPDIGFEMSKLAIFYNTEGEMVYNVNGEEIGTLQLTKIIKDQYENISGYRTISIRAKTWREMDSQKQFQFTENLLQRYNIRSF